MEECPFFIENPKFVALSFPDISTFLHANGEEKKKPSLPDGWQTLTESSFSASHTACALKTGRESGVTVVDFDFINLDGFEKILEKHPELSKYMMVKKKSGCHIYCRYNPDIPSTTVDYGEGTGEGFDIKNDGDFVICPPSSLTLLNNTSVEYEYVEGDILPFPEFLKDKSAGDGQKRKRDAFDPPDLSIEKGSKHLKENDEWVEGDDSDVMSDSGSCEDWRDESETSRDLSSQTSDKCEEEQSDSDSVTVLGINYQTNWFGKEFKTMEPATYIDIISKDNTMCEATGGVEEVCNLYFDIEYYFDSQEMYEENVDRFKGYEAQYIEDMVRELESLKQGDQFELVGAVAHRNKKFSLRLFCPSHKAPKSTIFQLAKYLNDKMEMNDIDEGVYDSNRKMRAINTLKPRKSEKTKSNGKHIWEKEDGSKLVLRDPATPVEKTMIQYWKHNSDVKDFTFLYERPNGRRKTSRATATATLATATLATATATATLATATTTLATASATTNPDDEVDTDKMDEVQKMLFILQRFFEKGNYCYWFKIGSILKNMFDDETIGLQYFQEATNAYGTANKRAEADNCFRKDIKRMKDGLSEKSLNYYCRLENSTLFETLFLNAYFISHDIINDAFECAKIISKTLMDNVVYCGDTWYVCNDKNLWRTSKEPAYYITREFKKYMDKNIQRLADKINECESNDEKESMRNQLNIYSKASVESSKSPWKHNYIQHLKTLLIDDRFAEKLDTNSGELAFQNGIYDVETNKFRSGFTPMDYITSYIPHDYAPCDETKLTFLRSKLLQIMNNDEAHLEYFLAVIGYSFLGTPHLDKSLYFCVDKTTGSAGDNGKTFFFDILATLMPNYVYKTNKSFLEDDNKKVHKQLVKMIGKRLCFLDEFDMKKIKSELMKVIGDGLKCENEVMYGTSETIIIFFKLFILTNHLPNIDAKETAVYNRYKQISYGSHFDRTGERKVENPELLQFIADTELGDKIKTEYCNEVFHLVIQYGHQFIVDGKLPPVPEQFLNDVKETKDTNDKFASWFNDECERNDDGDGKIPLKLLIAESSLSKGVVMDGMVRLGFHYEKDLCRMGKDPTGKYYKGGYQGCHFIPEQEVEGNID